MDLAPAALTRVVGEPLSPQAIDRGKGRMLRWVETVAGPDAPTIVLVGGAGETCLDWPDLLSDLAARGRVVAYDRAGLGASDPPPGGRARIEASVDDLAALLDAVGPAILVGHSWGGLLSQLVTYAHPDAVTGLVLVDPTHEDVFAAVPWRMLMQSSLTMRVMRVLHALRLHRRYLDGMARPIAERSTSDPAAVTAYLEAYRAAYASRLQFGSILVENALAVGCKQVVAPIRAAAKPVGVPLVLLAATGKPPMLRDRALALHGQVVEAAPRGRLVVVDAGHYIHHERPETVVTAVDTVIADSL